MSNNYEDYGYEDSYDDDDKGSVIRKRILIIVLIIIAILLVIFLLKSCGKKKPNDTPTTTKAAFVYEDVLLEAGKKYFDNNTNELPKSIGECVNVDLKTLVDRGLVNPDEFSKCNNETTIVKVCRLENEKLHFVPWLVCTDKESDKEYDESKEGTMNDVVADKSYIDFRYLPMVLKKGDQKLGKEEELWKEDIKYDAYKTISTTTYYRYKDQQFKWNLVDKIYYTSTGTKTNASDVKEYYTSSPASGYDKNSDKATAYKWYTTTEGTKEYYMKDGKKSYSVTAPSGYPNKDMSSEKIAYERSYPVKHYYACVTSDGRYTKYSLDKCGTGDSKNYPKQTDEFDSCTEKSNPSAQEVVNGKEAAKIGRCVVSRNTTACTSNEKYTCVKMAAYYWYKVSGGTRSYYPSGKDNSNLEKVYYTEAPVKDAIKDESTKATAYKWYKEGAKRTSDYSATAPKGYPDATKTSDSRWTEFTSWSAKKPASASYRKIESKVKVKLQEIQGTNESSFEDIGTEYVTLEEMIKIYTDKGYKVETLDDITANGELKYKVKMLIRNKKEAK